MTRPREVTEAAGDLRAALLARGDPAAVAALQRYFPEPVEAVGVSNADVAALATGTSEPTPTRPRRVSPSRRRCWNDPATTKM